MEVENNDLAQTYFTVMAVRNDTVMINKSFTAGPGETYAMLMGVGSTPYEFVLVANEATSTYTVHPGCPLTGIHVRWSGGREPTAFTETY